MYTCMTFPNNKIMKIIALQSSQKYVPIQQTRTFRECWYNADYRFRPWPNILPIWRNVQSHRVARLSFPPPPPSHNLETSPNVMLSQCWSTICGSVPALK